MIIEILFSFMPDTKYLSLYALIILHDCCGVQEELFKDFCTNNVNIECNGSVDERIELL